MLPAFERLAVLDDVGLPQQTERTVVQSPLSSTSAIGRTARFAHGVVVTADRSTVIGSVQLARGDLGRFTQGPLGARACRGAASSTGDAASLTNAPCVAQVVD